MDERASTHRECLMPMCAETIEIDRAICTLHESALTRDHLDRIYRAFNRYASNAEQSAGCRKAVALASSWIRSVLSAEESVGTKPSWNRMVDAVRARDAARREIYGPRPTRPGTRVTSTGVQLKLV